MSKKSMDRLMKQQIKVRCPTIEATTVILHVIFLSVPKNVPSDMYRVIK